MRICPVREGPTVTSVTSVTEIDDAGVILPHSDYRVGNDKRNFASPPSSAAAKGSTSVRAYGPGPQRAP